MTKRRIVRAVFTATRHCATMVRSLSLVAVGGSRSRDMYTITNLCCKTKRVGYDGGCRISTTIQTSDMMMRSSSLGFVAGDVRIRRHFGSSSVVVDDDESTSEDDLRNEIEEIELMAEVKEANERCVCHDFVHCYVNPIISLHDAVVPIKT